MSPNKRGPSKINETDKTEFIEANCAMCLDGTYNLCMAYFKSWRCQILEVGANNFSIQY